MPPVGQVLPEGAVKAALSCGAAAGSGLFEPTATMADVDTPFDNDDVDG